jgi:pre-mRNA-splicing factor SYF2
MSEEKKGNEVATQEEQTNQGTDFETRLFELRLKINQGRKANRTEAETEYDRLVQRNRKNKKKKGKTDEEEEEDVDLDLDNNEEEPKKKEDKSKDGKDPLEGILNQTAQEAEWVAGRNQHKKEVAATYGLNSFTTDAYYRAYEKRVKKLQNKKLHGQLAEEENFETQPYTKSSLELNPFDYGKVNASTSAEGLERMQKDVLEREENRKKFSRRRMFTDSENVDYINDKNAQFNKKLKRSFDKYTLEIRQNLERGTAI